MPCRDGREHEDDEQMRQRLDAATRVACELCELLRKPFTALWVFTSPMVRAWCKEHERIDNEQAEQGRR